MSECVVAYHTKLMSTGLDALLSPLVSAFGGKYKGSQPGGARAPKRPTAIDYSDDEQVKRAKARDARIMAQGSRIAGIEIEL